MRDGGRQRRPRHLGEPALGGHVHDGADAGCRVGADRTGARALGPGDREAAEQARGHVVGVALQARSERQYRFVGHPAAPSTTSARAASTPATIAADDEPRPRACGIALRHRSASPASGAPSCSSVRRMVWATRWPAPAAGQRRLHRRFPRWYRRRPPRAPTCRGGSGQAQGVEPGPEVGAGRGYTHPAGLVRNAMSLSVSRPDGPTCAGPAATSSRRPSGPGPLPGRTGGRDAHRAVQRPEGVAQGVLDLGSSRSGGRRPPSGRPPRTRPDRAAAASSCAQP